MSKDEMAEIFRNILEEEREKHWVDLQTHYEHHRFIKGWVWALGVMKKGALLSFIGGLITGVGMLVWLGLQAAIKLKGVVGG
jgi:hypothetical protein